MERPVRKFLMKLILEEAIAFEEKSYRYYKEALGKATMEDSFDLLKKLIAAELKHRIKLEEVQRSGDLHQLRGREGVSLLEGSHDIENIEEICSDWPELNPSDSRKRILEIALQKEKCALNFYKTMSDNSRLKAIQAVFNALFEEEKRHVQWIQNELARVS